MAEGKKSFLFYVDWDETFNALPDDKAGQLIKHLCAYVRDKNPKSEDVLINAVFANMKATLKRDLEKWRLKSQKNSESARKRWNANASERIKRNTKDADTDTVIDTDTVKVNVIYLKEEKIEISNLYKFIEDNFQLRLGNWTKLLPPNTGLKQICDKIFLKKAGTEMENKNHVENTILKEIEYLNNGKNGQRIKKKHENLFQS